ncbi:hypothetical protein [Paraliobacillus sp. X-1268]|uniref:hypothetical protein n=1 Tax=Paraliobacillus sp. X-1268 TaxID=2213193 RepID=UPI001E52075E|nr:hypothetical protein [Paraliobacillus sp. X-1268]
MFSKKIVYEIFMVILATLSIATLWTNLPYTSYIVWITWGIFFADFVYRLYKSQNKFDFLKSNPFLLVAVIPLDAVFQVARFARILHLLRLKTITKYYTMPFVAFLKKQHYGLTSAIISVILICMMIILVVIEPGIITIKDAGVSVITAVTFFGEATFSPTTMVGHTIVVLTTIIGVMIHGFVISLVFDYVANTTWLKKLKEKTFKKKNAS